MSQSLSQLHVHIIFHVKYNSPKIEKTTRKDLFSYIASIIKDNESTPIIVNGIEDHVHILCILSKNIALSKLVEEVKRHSSRWIKTQNSGYKNFAWQGGYAGFSVSPSVHAKTRKYIENQEEHHKKRSFQDEYTLFLKEYGIEYNDKYLWED